MTARTDRAGLNLAAIPADHRTWTDADEAVFLAVRTQREQDKRATA